LVQQEQKIGHLRSPSASELGPINTKRLRQPGIDMMIPSEAIDWMPEQKGQETVDFRPLQSSLL
jgi:hypothetical protein